METKLSLLYEYLKLKSYREGDFTLSSGEKSNYYFDCRQTTLNGYALKLIAEIICDRLKPTIVGIGGLTLGADPIIAGVSLYSTMNYELPNTIHGFIVRKKVKQHGTSNQIEGMKNLSSGDDVAIVDDVVTSGNSILTACKAANNIGLNVKQTICIVDRLEGGQNMLFQHGYHLEKLFDVSHFFNIKS